MKNHICLIPTVNSQSNDGYQATCLGFIKGKVLKVELTSNKFDKTDKPCIKINEKQPEQGR